MTPLVLFVRLLAFKTGLWCPHCALPSGLQMRIGIISARTGEMVAERTDRRCHDCGARIEEDA